MLTHDGGDSGRHGNGVYYTFGYTRYWSFNSNSPDKKLGVDQEIRTREIRGRLWVMVDRIHKDKKTRGKMSKLPFEIAAFLK